MGFLKKLADFFSAPAQSEAPTHWSYVQCGRCGEKIRTRVDLRNDISIQYGDTDAANTYFARKTIIGEQRCYQPIEVELTFDRRRKLIDQQISGGKFISEEEYYAEADSPSSEDESRT